MSAPDAAVVHDLFESHRCFLWALCYRMTGCAADADDLVQETFVRAIERPPRRQDLPWRPWLVRVALNLCRDALRRRKRREYAGPWLPSPIETADDQSPISYEVPAPGPGTEARYDLIESVSFAFLLALEALTPRQRAVLLLRDVLDYSVRETAGALDMTEVNVKTTLHRARHAMLDYERMRRANTAPLQRRTREALERFMQQLAAHDVAGIERTLAAGIRVVTDGGGEFVAALNPIVGRPNAIRFLLKVSARARAGARVAVRTINGWPGVVLELPAQGPRHTPRLVFRCDLDAEGRIRTVHVVAATRKLTAIAPIA